MISGLTISAGDPVRFLLLTEGPYKDSPACYSHSLWFPRTFPVRGVYDDYGGVKEIEDGPLKDLFLKGIQKDVIEVGWGDNACHDVPVRKEMTFDGLLDAVSGRRVRVRREVSFESSRDMPPKKDRDDLMPVRKIPVGVPTLKRIEKILTDAGHGICGKYEKSDDKTKAFMVDVIGGGEVRVRAAGWGDNTTDDLKTVLPLFKKKYAAMLSAGMRRSTDSAEIRICPKPGTKDHFGTQGYINRRDERSLRVEAAMIREDVWQAVIEQPALDYDKPVKVESFRHNVHHGYKSTIESLRKFSSAGKEELRSLRWSLLDLDSIPGIKNHVPFTVGVGTCWAMLLNHALNTNTDLSDDVLNTIGELAFVERQMYTMRCYWRPSYSIGPQFGEWGAHAKLLKAFTDIAQREAKKQEDEDR